MGLDEKIIRRLDSLIALGVGVLGTAHDSGRAMIVDRSMATQWITSSLHLIRTVFTKESDHFQQLEAFNKDITYLHNTERALSVLRAAKDDYEQGMLFDTRTLIEAEVFDDLLEQAEHLLKMGYYQPAAVVAGAVLEDGLRKLCARNNVPVSPTAKVETMNAELTRANVYNGLVQKQVTMFADLRNKAAHGQWTEFTEAQVVTMLPQVRAFMTQHFS